MKRVDKGKVDRVRKLLAEGYSTRKVAQIADVSRKVVLLVRNGTWKDPAPTPRREFGTWGMMGFEKGVTRCPECRELVHLPLGKVRCLRCELLDGGTMVEATGGGCDDGGLELVNGEREAYDRLNKTGLQKAPDVRSLVNRLGPVDRAKREAMRCFVLGNTGREAYFNKDLIDRWLTSNGPSTPEDVAKGTGMSYHMVTKTLVQFPDAFAKASDGRWGIVG